MVHYGKYLHWMRLGKLSICPAMLRCQLRIGLHIVSSLRLSVIRLGSELLFFNGAWEDHWADMAAWQGHLGLNYFLSHFLRLVGLSHAGVCMRPVLTAVQ